MYEELASVRGIVDLSPEEVLNSAELFLERLGYEVLNHTDTSVVATRTVSGGARKNITVSAQLQPGGGVKVRIRGNDQEGVRADHEQWAAWSDGLPKKQGSIEIPNLPMPAPPQPAAPTLPDPPPAPASVAPPPPRESTVWRGTKLALGGCVILPLLLLGGLVGCAAIVGALGGFGDTAPSEPTPEVRSVVIRVSGSPGLRYSGNYGTSEGGGRSVDGEVSTTPVEYPINVESGALDFDMVTAIFQKMGRQGTLRVEIVVDGQVVKMQETSAAYGTVDVSYSPQLD